MGMKNDLSFLIDWNLNIFEHQSTYNPNMPLRGFIYTGSAFKKYIEKNHLDMYASKQLTIPVPRYYVFYNGLKKAEDEVVLRLTDSMVGTDVPEKSSAEFTAHMININAGHSTKMIKRCPLLHQYSLFVAALRENIAEGLPLNDAIESTVTDCINQGVLAELLRAHRAEVTNMLFKEYDSAAHIASEKEISYEEGVQDGIRRGLQQSEQAVAEEKARADKLQIEASILSYYAQSKSIDEIAVLCEQSSDFVVNILKKYNLR
ncbi:hypothetical protein NIA28_07135 [Coprococcus catus]|nr:hypothetical protein [Coprococcus catus]MCO7146169.1 hypothetical protein [Coprococcus catus]